MAEKDWDSMMGAQNSRIGANRESNLSESPSCLSASLPDHKLSVEELVSEIRLDLSKAYEAIHLCMAHAEATDHPLAKRVLAAVGNEERDHAGEFSRLIEILTGDKHQQSILLARGAQKVDQMAADLEAAKQSK